MEVTGLAHVNWATPWLAPFADLGQAVAACTEWRASFNEAAAAANVRNFNEQRIVFCEPALASNEPYETGIARTGRVPTRSNLHDFFNALIFLHFPRAKAQLNRLQSAALARDGVRAVRGSVRDAATLIDESAVLLVTDRADLIDSLRGHDWQSVFQSKRATWSTEASVVVFGHALLEKLAKPYKAITAHALHIPLPANSPLQEIDRCMAAALDEQLSPADLMPLPVLGVPGWCAQNENPDFYSDSAVFRPAKMRRDCKAETDS